MGRAAGGAEPFWGAGYTDADLAALSSLWHSDEAETKAHAGQMILDGDVLPIAPGAKATSSPHS